MFFNVWRFITITLVALLMGTTFCHMLEVPAKMHYEGPLYLTLQKTLYVAFGLPNIGAFVEFGAILGTSLLAFISRGSGPVFKLTLAAVILLLFAFPVIFYIFVEPANIEFRKATIEPLPANWLQLREQWEYGHAARFVLHLLAFGGLLLSLFVEDKMLAAEKETS